MTCASLILPLSLNYFATTGHISKSNDQKWTVLYELYMALPCSCLWPDCSDPARSSLEPWDPWHASLGTDNAPALGCRGTEFRESRRSELRGGHGGCCHRWTDGGFWPSISLEAGREGCNLNRWRSLVASNVTGNLRKDLFLCNLAHFVLLSLDCIKFFWP